MLTIRRFGPCWDICKPVKLITFEKYLYKVLEEILNSFRICLTEGSLPVFLNTRLAYLMIWSFTFLSKNYSIDLFLKSSILTMKTFRSRHDHRHQHYYVISKHVFHGFSWSLKIKSYLNLILLEVDLVKSIKKLLERKSRKGRINVLID